MLSRRGVLVLLASPLALRSAFAAPARKPAPAKKGLASDFEMQVSEEDRCPVCGKAVKAGAPLGAALALKSGTTYYFCETGCFLKAWIHQAEVLGRKTPEDAIGVVREYTGGRPVNAASVSFVAGSDVAGANGPAVVAVKPADVKTFQERHGGKMTFRLREVDDALLAKVKALPRDGR